MHAYYNTSTAIGYCPSILSNGARSFPLKDDEACGGLEQ